ncbi:hypothetical protein MMC28_001959, partial [Mycoblastus sanguinarius]|nr:hypothetical protein [Mycoblastus sanguinarius]
HSAIPISALHGDNFIETSTKSPWFYSSSSEHKTLVEAINTATSGAPSLKSEVYFFDPRLEEGIWNHPEKHLQHISSCKIGMIFLGTPHHGAGLDAWAKFGTTIIRIIKRANIDVVFVLKPGSEMLIRVQDGYYDL